jgi:hypothetical protein
MPKPKIRLNDFIKIESLTEYESIGNMPCPSCTKALVNNTEKGIIPLANKETKIICGPDSGISPINAAITKSIKGYS